MVTNWSLRGFFVVLVAGVSLYSTFLSAETESSDPGAEEVVTAIFANSETTLPAAQNCGEEEISVGRYFERALVTMEGQTDGAALTARCNRVAVNQELIELYTTDLYPSRTGDALRAVGDEQEIHQCELTLAHDKGQNPWSRELRFLMYGADSTAVEGSFRCLSSP